MDAVIERHKPALRVAHAPAPARLSAQPSLHASVDTPSLTPQQLVAPGRRIVVVAPHPDDEVLALGGTIASLARAGHEVLIVAVTDGEKSHPESRFWTPGLLRQMRPMESQDALARLALDPAIVRLGLPDGGVPAHERRLAELLPLGSHDTVFVPWRHDGHPDHEACARAALAACRTIGAQCIEFPVWALVPGHPAFGRVNPGMLQKVEIASALAEEKRHAIGAFVSQTHPDGETPAVLHHGALLAWQQAHEWVMA
jgi:LmbE family N-acetylglucosaminyl deacetylase